MTDPTPAPFLSPLLDLAPSIGTALALFVFALASVVSPLGASTGDSAETEPARALDRLFERSFAEQLELDPSLAARIGDPRHRDRLTVALTEEHRRAARAWIERHGAALTAIDREALDPRRRVFYDAFRWQLDAAEEALEHPGHLLPLQPGFGLPADFSEMAAGHLDLDLSDPVDVEAFLGRANDFVAWVDAAIASLEEGKRRGIVHPKVIVRRAMRELRDLSSSRSNAFHRAVGRVPGTEPALRVRLGEAAEERILPAYRRLHDYLDKEYLPAARDTLGLSELPGGEAWYRQRVRFYTSTELDPETIFEMGEREVKRIKKALSKARRRNLFGGEGYSSSRGRVLERFERVEETVRRHLPRLFGRLPTTPLEVRPVEPGRSGVAAGAFYEVPKGDGPGIFYVALDRGFDLSTAEVLYLHEALPGHHLQIALARESVDLPPFLRYGYVGAYIEGWGLYCESLGDELGLYGDADQRVGRLRYALGRAGRLLGDVGLHHFGWSRGRAESELGRRNLEWAVREIERYAMLPGQGLAYTVGEIRFRELRRRAETELGEDFDLRAFHDLVLGHGPLPLDVLEREVDRWIDDHRRTP